MSDEAGTVLVDDRPWRRLGLVACFILFASLLWVVSDVGERGQGWRLNQVVADAALFLGIVGTILGGVMIHGFTRTDQAIAPAYQLFFGVVVVLTGACSWIGYRLRAGFRLKKSLRGDVDFDS